MVPTSWLLAAGLASVRGQGVLGRPRTDPFALFADAVLVMLAVLYAGGLRRDPARDRSAQAAVVMFALGLLLLYVALGSGLAASQFADPSVDVGQHVLLMMVVPALLVLGQPGRVLRLPRELWKARRLRAPDGLVEPLPGTPPGPGRRAARRAVVASARAASGVASWPLYYGTMAAYFLTAAYAASLRDPVLFDATQVAFVAVGLLFWTGLVGTGRDGVRRSSTFRFGAVIAGMPVETAVGLALVLWPRPLASGQSLAASHSAGLLFWLAAMFTSGVALAVLLVQWCIADSKRAELHEALAFTPDPTGSDAGVGRSRP